MAKPQPIEPAPEFFSSPMPVADTQVSQKKARAKRETAAEREIREWHEYCDAIADERRKYLREEELEMLVSQRRDHKEPTEPRREYAAHIKWETELLEGKDGVTVPSLMRSVAAILPLLRSVEDDEHFVELSREDPTMLPRREIRWLMRMAKRWAM